MTDTPDPVDVACGARVRHYRKYVGKSQSELASAIGIPFQQGQKYERGANRISVSMLKRIAGFLEVRAAELMGEAGPPVADRMLAGVVSPNR